MSVSVLSVGRRLRVKPMGKIEHWKCLSAWPLKFEPWSSHLEGSILKVELWRSKKAQTGPFGANSTEKCCKKQKPVNTRLFFSSVQTLRDHMPEGSKIYLSRDTTDKDQAVHYPVEFLNSLNPVGLPPHKLTLKIGVPIMLLRNLGPSKVV